MASMAWITRMDIRTDSLSKVRLMQLISPTLPIGAFTYSQGLEYAVECGWTQDVASLQSWLRGLLFDSMAQLEVPVLARLYQACANQDVAQLDYWAGYLLASRETAELRQEDINRARAITTLLQHLGIEQAQTWRSALIQSQTAPFALAAISWSISLTDAAQGYVWSWLENQVAAAIKLIPLGQTDGQRVQMRLAEHIPSVVSTGLALPDDEIGASAPALAIASSLHETQYTRLFRS